MPDSYLETSELEQELPFTAKSFGLSETDWDGLLNSVMSDEADRIREWTGAVYTPEIETVTLSGSDARGDGYDLVLPNAPIRSVTSITVDGDPLDSSEYYVDETHVEHLGRHGWPDGRRNVEIEYEFGYNDLPGPVREGLIRLVRSRLEQRKTDGLESESGGDTSYSYRPSSEVRAEVRATVRQYRPSTYDIGGALI